MKPLTLKEVEKVQEFVIDTGLFPEDEMMRWSNREYELVLDSVHFNIWSVRKEYKKAMTELAEALNVNNIFDVVNKFLRKVTKWLGKNK